MRGISEKRLKAILHNQVLTPKTQSFIQYLIDDECRELQEPWMTLEEFLKSGFIGLCWIMNTHQEVWARNFDGYYFINPHLPNYPIHKETIDRVMPIHKPEPPK